MRVVKAKNEKDVSRKLYREDMLVISELQISLLRRGRKVSQKDLIHSCIRLAASNDENEIKYIEKEDKTKEVLE